MLNKVHVRAIAAVLCVLTAATPAPSSAKDDGSDESRQIHPAMTLASLFPEAEQIGLAVAVVPDPLVPRYRRLYDLELVAIELGMLKKGYVLDRFYLPWNEKLRRTGAEKQTAGHEDAEPADPPHPDGKSADLPFNRGAYGLLLFRCDSWRHVLDEHLPNEAQTREGQCGGSSAPDTPQGAGNGTRFQALFIVTDTSTKGVESRALGCVIGRITSQLTGPQPGESHRLHADTDHADKACWAWQDQRQDQPGVSPIRRPDVRLLRYPEVCEERPAASTLVVLGPNFSGAIDSVGEISERLGNEPGGITAICLVSASTTDDTNDLVSQRYPRVGYANLALDDRRKILHIRRLVQALTGQAVTGQAVTGQAVTDSGAGPASHDPPEDARIRVAILAEASTFGHGICNQRDHTHSSSEDHEFREFCDEALFFYFPANIADVRYGLQEQRNLQARNSDLKLPSTSEHLSLELGAENGSEYPDSQQSGLTSVSAELALERVLDTLKEVDPDVVIVVATDVRDRLFLFDELRDRLRRAMLIDLEADNLLGHPDFLHASRGAIAMSSVNLSPRVHTRKTQADRKADEQAPGPTRDRAVNSWSSDVQALLARAVTCLTDTIPAGKSATSDQPKKQPCGLPVSASSPDQRPERQAVIHVVTLEGFKRVSKPFPLNETPPDSRLLTVAERGAPVLCAAAAWLWMYPLVIAGGGWRQRSMRIVKSASYIAYVVCAVYAAVLLAVAFNIQQDDYDNAVLYWIVAALAGGFAGMLFCLFVLRHASRAASPLTYWNVWAPALFAAAAAAMASMPLWWLHKAQTAGQPFGAALDLKALTRLGLDPDPGLAFLLLVAVATLALLYTSVVLATSAGIVNRNSTLLRNAQPAPGRNPVTTDLGEIYPTNRDGIHPANRRGIRHMNPFGLLAVVGVLIAAIVGPDLYMNNVRLTIFGQFASVVALLAMTATTCAAAVLACSAIAAARRVAAISKHILIVRSAASAAASPGPWPLDQFTPRVFPATPVITTVADGGHFAKRLRKTDNLTAWTRLLTDWLYNGRDTGQQRVAVFTLLATELSVYQWSLAGAVLCTLASVGCVYLFPIEADQLLLLNLLILVALGVATGYVASAFERDELLCNVLCNRKAGRRFSVPLFACIAIPFLVFAIAIAIANVPGVVDWGGGLLQLLKTLGVHA